MHVDEGRSANGEGPWGLRLPLEFRGYGYGEGLKVLVKVRVQLGLGFRAGFTVNS